MSTIKINELADGSISITDLMIKSGDNGLATKITLSQLQTFLNTIGVSGYKGVILASDPAVTEDGIYVAGNDGTYTNNGGFVITLDNKFILISKIGASFDKVEIPLNITLASLASIIDDTPTPNSDKLVKSGGVVDYFLKNSLKESWLSSNYYNTKNWISTSGGSISDDVVIIKSNEIQAKIQIPTNEIVSGQKYIMLINVEDLTALHPNATSLIFFNYTQKLHEHSLTDDRKIVAVTFTANNGGNNIQVVVGGDVNGGTPSTGTDLISFRSKFIGFIPWTQEKEDLYKLAETTYSSSNFSTYFALEAAKARKADIAENSTNSVNSENADFAKRIGAFFEPTNSSQIQPNEWILSSGGTKNSDGEITINKNIQPKILVPNTTTVGQKYIMFAHIDKPVILDNSAVSLRFYNYSVELFSIPLTAPAFNYAVFTSTVDNVIQVLVGGTFTGVADGTPLCSFVSKCIAVVEWSQELEDLFLEVKKNYKGGDFNLSRGLHSYKELKTEFPQGSFETATDLSSRTKEDYANNIPAWNSVSGATNVINEVVNQEINGETVPVWRVGGDLDVTISNPRLWFGFDIRPENYASESKTYVIVAEGKVTATNIDDFKFTQTSGKSFDLAQDLVDGIETPFKVLDTFFYNAGQTSNSRYTYTFYTRRDVNINDINFLAEFTTFSVFEQIDGFGIDDYIEAAKNGIIEAVYAKGYAKTNYVDNQIETALGNVAKLSPNDLNPLFDVEMYLSGGQSLNVGGGASSATTDWKNVPTFALGNSLYARNFSTQAEKDAFFGSGFILMEDNVANEQYPPVTASTNTILTLLNAENKVDVESFGLQIMPFTWGLSGNSIISMEQGTTAYNNMIECVTKAKEFANKQGKTFGVRSMNWYHGEADRNQTKQWYYDKMSQLFIDVNTDVKAITGQTEDIQFFTYQTSPWLGRDVGTVMTHINIQEAQMQVVKDFANVHFCGAMYQFAYADFYHPTDRAVVGLQTGVAMKRVLYDAETWKNFLPVSHQVINDGTNYFVHLKFDVPVKPMRFDISGDAWHNPLGKQTNFGFEVLSGTTELQTAEPFIRKGDTVVLSTGTTNPVGATIRYAVNGHDGGGNLCDSQNIIVNNKNQNYVIDNFAGAFSEYIIT